MVMNRTIWRYALTGGVTAALYVVLYVAFLAMGVAQGLANGISFFLAVAFQYIAHAAFTFAVPVKDGLQITRFVVMIAAGFLMSAVITGWIGPQLGMSDWMSATVVAVVLPLQNYVVMSLWVFARPLRKKECAE